MKESYQCPNCRGPLSPAPDQATVSCTYCGHQAPNPLHKPAAADDSDRQARRFLVLILVLTLVPVGVIVLIVVGLTVVPAVVSSSVTVQTRQSSVGPARNARTQPYTPPAMKRQEVLDRLVGCLDFSYTSVASSRARYLRWVSDPEQGPTCKERYVSYGLYPVSNDRLSDCNQALEQRAAEDAALPAERAAARAYVEAVQTVSPLTLELDRYYEGEKYRLDGCRRGRELHLKLMQGFAAVDQARGALRERLAEHTRGSLDACIELLKSGSDAPAALVWAQMVKAAGDLVTRLRALTSVKPVQLEPMKAAVVAFNAVAERLEGMDAAAKDQAGYHSGRGLEELREAAMELLKSRGGVGFSTGQRIRLRNAPRREVEGTFEHVVLRYNELLEEFARHPGCARLLRCEPDSCPDPR